MALYVFSRGLTRLLVLDLDPKGLGRGAVMDDAQRLRNLIADAGGACFADINPTSGGIHLLVPLAEPHSPQSLRPLLNQLQRRFPTLDISPMTNAAVGCFMPPGSATREGGRRELLDATLTTATDVLISGAGRGLIDRMLAALGTIPVHKSNTPEPTPTALGERLTPALALDSPLPTAIRDFAKSGSPHAIPARWGSASEARFAVLVACAQRGWSRRDVELRTDWKGLWSCYDRYMAHHRRTAFQKDWSRALAWAITHAEKFRSPGHKRKAHRGGTRPAEQWLAHATAWASSTFAGTRHCHTVLAVLQGLSYCATVAGELVHGTPTVAVGRRSLSIASGLLPDTTVGDVLAELRDMPGSPILLARQAAGTTADRYALVTPAIRETNPTRAARVRTDPVHLAWRVLGGHLRRVYEAVESGLSDPADVFAAARIGTAAGHSTLAALAAAGLITRPHGTVELGPVSLDEVAAAHGLDELREETIQRFRNERALWHAWLEVRGHLEPQLALFPRHPVPAPNMLPPAEPAGWHTHDELLWRARMAEGPPPADNAHDMAVDLVTELLGGVILTSL